MATEVEETVKRIQAQKGVAGEFLAAVLVLGSGAVADARIKCLTSL